MAADPLRRVRDWVRRPPSPSGGGSALPARAGDVDPERLVDLRRRRDALTAHVAELQWDLGGLVYEMAIRDRIRTQLIVTRAAELQVADSELREIERILLLEQSGIAGSCTNCGAPHSSGAVYCWQCGQPLMTQVSPDAIGAS